MALPNNKLLTIFSEIHARYIIKIGGNSLLFAIMDILIWPIFFHNRNMLIIPLINNLFPQYSPPMIHIYYKKNKQL